MKYGTLRVTMPDGQARDYPLDVPQAVIGRSPENSVVIDHISIARRHARLTIDSGSPYLEDLGSDTGTFVAGRRLEAGERALVAEGIAVQLGDIPLAYTTNTTTAAASQSRVVMPGSAAGASVPAAQPLHVTLSGPASPVAPGSTTTVTVQLQNRGGVVDEVLISVPDLPGTWVEVSRPIVPLLPGARDEVTIILRPPKATDAAAGDHPFSVAVTSREHGTEIRVLGTLTLQSFQGFTFGINPVRSTGKYTLRTENTGNSPVALALAGVDDDGTLNFDFGALNIDLKPGERRDVALQVRRRGAPKFGRETVYPFKVEAHEPTPGAPKTMVDGQLRHKPPLQAWKWPVIGLVGVLALAGGVVGYTANCEDQGWPGCGTNTPPVATATAAGGGGQTQIPGGGPTTPATGPTTPATGPKTPATGPTTPATGPTTPATGPTTPATGPTTPTGPPTTPAGPIKKPTFTKPGGVLNPRSDYTATISTTKGDFVIDLETARAFNTSNSFAFLAEQGFFDGLPFSGGRGTQTLSGGDPIGDGSGTPSYALDYEPTGLKNTLGTIAMIPTSKNKFGSQFYINLRANVQYDTGGIAADIRPPFGTVVKGIEVVQALVAGDKITKVVITEKTTN